jgi:hypothetical protein
MKCWMTNRWMTNRWMTVGALAALLTFPPALLIGPACADDVPAQIQALVAKQSQAIVTVKAVLKMNTKGGGTSQSSESRAEMQGVVVDSSGLVMVSSISFSPEKMMEMMGMPKEVAVGSPKITPTDFKVIFEREEKEYPAFLAATDTTLGLTFVQITDLAGRTLTPVMFADTPAPALGNSVFALSRLSKGYDYAPFYESARVSGAIAKPRAALMLDGGISEVGLPIFTLSGAPIGVLTSIASGVSSSESNEGMSMRMMMRLFGGGGGGNRPGLFVVPSSVVSPVIAQAKTRAAEIAAQRAKTPPAPAK